MILAVLDYATIMDRVIPFLFGSLPFTGAEYENKISFSTYTYLIFLVLVILYTYLIWFLSVKITSQVRTGIKKDIKLLLPLRLRSVLSKLEPNMVIKSFPNSQIAQVWFELRNNGLIIPVWTGIFWFLLFTLYVSVMFILLAMRWIVSFDYSYLLDLLFVFFPLIALVLSGLVWHLKVSRRMRRDYKSGVYLLSHIPMNRKERIYTYWLAGNINLFITLPVIWI
ncbi:MAG: hypothetical protein ACP5UA_01395 [Candidatus Hydrogenedens sp.]